MFYNFEHKQSYEGLKKNNLTVILCVANYANLIIEQERAQSERGLNTDNILFFAKCYNKEIY
jgi:hypothetical protein